MMTLIPVLKSLTVMMGRTNSLLVMLLLEIRQVHLENSLYYSFMSTLTEVFCNCQRFFKVRVIKNKQTSTTTTTIQRQMHSFSNWLRVGWLREGIFRENMKPEYGLIVVTCAFFSDQSYLRPAFYQLNSLE